MKTESDAHLHSAELHDVMRQANKIWLRAGVRRTDRNELSAELATELDGAYHDGHDMTSVLGDDSAAMLREWADERGRCGRAWRFQRVVPAAFVGALSGLALVLLVLVLGFSDSSTAFDPGPFVLPFYASGGLLGYLCALLCVGGVLRLSGDPNATSTVRWLAALLPLGAVLAICAGVAVAWWRNFNTSVPVFVAVTGVVVTALALAIGCARYIAVEMSLDRETHS